MTTYYRTVYTVEVLSAIPPNDMDDLDQIAYDIREGEASGKVERSSFEEVSAEHMRDLLIAQGSEPSFLLGDDEAEAGPKAGDYPLSATAEATEMPSGSGWAWLVKDGDTYWGVNEDPGEKIDLDRETYEGDLHAFYPPEDKA